MTTTISATDLRPSRNCSEVRVSHDSPITDDQRSEIERRLLHDHGIHHSSECFGAHGLRFFVDPEMVWAVESEVTAVLMPPVVRYGIQEVVESMTRKLLHVAILQAIDPNLVSYLNGCDDHDTGVYVNATIETLQEQLSLVRPEFVDHVFEVGAAVGEWLCYHYPSWLDVDADDFEDPSVRLGYPAIEYLAQLLLLGAMPRRPSAALIQGDLPFRARVESAQVV